jgi:hypothetical protein
VSFPLCKIDQHQIRGDGSIINQYRFRFVQTTILSLDGGAMSYVWYESYKAVVLETDWTKMHDRIHSAECKMHDRQRELSADHGGTPEERQAIVNALNGMRTLRTEVAYWQSRQASASDPKSTSEIAAQP